MKKYLAAIAAVFALYGAVRAETGLDTIAAESSVAASYGNLDTARTLSGKQIDGSLLKSSDAETVRIGELVSAQKEELKMSEPVKVSLKTEVPSLKEESLAKQGKADRTSGVHKRIVNNLGKDAPLYGFMASVISLTLLVNAVMNPPVFLALSTVITLMFLAKRVR